MKKYTTLAPRGGSFGLKLKEYSVLAGSVLATSFAAQGQVVYTDVNPDKELGGFIPGSFPYIAIDSLDLNNDGSFDFQISLDMYGQLAGGGISFREQIVGNGFSNWPMSYTIDYLHFGLKADGCDSIPPGTYFFGSPQANFAFQFANNVAYIWDNVHDKYLGLKFQIMDTDTTIHYGWVRLDVNTLDTIPNIIIKDYAYEKTPFKKIAVCDTGLGLPDHVAQLEKINQFSVFPNPSSGKGVIRLEQPLTGEVEIAVNDAFGRKAYQSKVSMSGNHKELPFDFSNLASGIYFIELKSESVSLTGKWIKN